MLNYSPDWWRDGAMFHKRSCIFSRQLSNTQRVKMQSSNFLEEDAFDYTAWGRSFCFLANTIHHERLTLWDKAKNKTCEHKEKRKTRKCDMEERKWITFRKQFFHSFHISVCPYSEKQKSKPNCPLISIAYRSANAYKYIIHIKCH